MTALGIMTHHPELNSVACLMGSGYFRSLSQTLFPSPDFDVDSLNEWDVSHQLASLARRPLLLWHGDADDVVPPEETFRLEQALRQADLAAGLTCVWQKGSAIALRQRRWLPRSPFSAAPLNADYADALILKLFEDRGIGLLPVITTSICPAG